MEFGLRACSDDCLKVLHMDEQARRAPLEHIAMFLKYFERCVLQDVFFGSIKHLTAPHFMEIQPHCPQVVPPMAKAVALLANIDICTQKRPPA